MSEDRQKQKQSTRTGSVTAKDPELAEWLQRFWFRDVPPERVEVFQAVGEHKRVRGEMVFHETFKPSAKLDLEQCVHLSNEMLAAMQNDCNARERKSSFHISVVDLNRGADPLVRLYGPVYQNKKSAVSHGNGSFDSDDDDSELNSSSLNLTHLRDGYKEVLSGQDRNDRVLGEVLYLQRNMLLQQQTFISSLMTQQQEFFNNWQAAEDRKDDRAVRRAMTELKVAGIKEGMRMTRTLLPSMFKSKDDSGKPSQNEQSTVQDFGPSEERNLVDNFLHDCEDTKITAKLFGEWEEKDGVWRPLEGPRIFEPEQFAILVGVRQGSLPPDALDKLLPTSNDSRAITQVQIVQAQGVMPESLGMTLMLLFKLRMQKLQPNETNAEPA